MASDKFCPDHSGVCRLVESIQKEIELRFLSLEKVTNATKGDLNVRLGLMNDLQKKLDRLADTFVPRTEIDLAITALENKVDILIEQGAERTGETKWTDHIITALIATGLALAIWLIKS